jgi:predicted transcriptional regulator
MLTLTIDGDLERRLEALGAITEPVKAQFIREAIVEAVQRIEEQEADAARWARVEAGIEDAFAGPTMELTDALWHQVLTADGDPSPGSLALPPDWKP